MGKIHAEVLMTDDRPPRRRKKRKRRSPNMGPLCPVHNLPMTYRSGGRGDGVSYWRCRVKGCREPSKRLFDDLR